MYEYIAGKEILTSNQQQIIEQILFIYSPLVKGFEKQIKTIEDQEQNQIKTLEDLKPKGQNKKSIEGKSNDKISIQKEIHNELLDERVDEIRKVSGEIDYKKLNYNFKTPGITPINFIKFKVPFSIFKEIRHYKKQKKIKKKFKSSLGEITSGNPKQKEGYQFNTIDSANNLYVLRQKVINLFNHNSRIKSEAIYKSKQNETEQGGTRLKILTPKQMLQRLPIALAQVKAGNNSENLLNEIRQIIYSLYQSKEITKKVYNNIIKSMQQNCIQL